MECPACHRALGAVTIGGRVVHVCSEGCAGIWFEPENLRRFTDPNDAAGEALATFAGTSQVHVDINERRRCPKCSHTVLMRHSFSATRAITVDECATCAGMWLDGGELGQIRSEYPSVEARGQAAHASAEVTMVDSRMSSLLVSFYLVVAAATAGASDTLRRLIFCLIPWACVCFPEAMGALISPILGPARQSSRRAVWFLGWLVLVLPLIQVLIILLQADGRSPFVR